MDIYRGLALVAPLGLSSTFAGGDGTLGGLHLQPRGVHAEEIGSGVSGLLHQQRVLKERQSVADLMDEDILLRARGSDLTDLRALHARDVGAVFHWGASLIVADSTLGHLDIHAH